MSKPSGGRGRTPKAKKARKQAPKPKPEGTQELTDEELDGVAGGAWNLNLGNSTNLGTTSIGTSNVGNATNLKLPNTRNIT